MSRPSRFLLAAVALASLCLAGAAAAQQRFYDPPGRVARISDMRGDLAYSPSGDGEWYSAHRNRPLVRGDALWADAGARAELQVGSTWLRMDGETSVEFLELSDRMLQVEVTEGRINVRIRRLYAGQRVEVDTPNLAVVLDRPGTYRIDVDREGDHTAVEVREGGGLVYGTGGRFPVRRGDLVVFYGEDIRDYEIYSFPAPDNFDRYARMRDQRIDQSPTLRYLGDDLVGFSDLDSYGRWGNYSGYGNVWFPNNTYAGWAPYQDGQWIWQEPWGWTWVDDQPWGFAPSHYGRWAWVNNRWGWIPGPRNTRSVYAPALVGFIEDAGSSIGWFPLGPGDIYYPSYSVSPTYFSSVNVANTRVASANVGRAYSSFGRANSVPLAQAKDSYRNRTVPTAVTTVPKDVFTSSRPVRQAQQRGREREMLGRGEMRRNLGVRPGAASVHGAAARARVRPPRAVEDEQVFVRNAPPAQAVTPSATPAPAPAVRERPRRVRAITEQAASADARASGPRQQPSAPAAAAAPGKPQALDREALQRERGARREARQQQRGQPQAPQPAAPAPAAAPAAATAPTPTPTAPASAPAPTAERANREELRQAAEARAAAEKAREENRQAMEAQRKAEQEKRQAERAANEATQQREQAQAQSEALQQREAADAEAKARVEREQARAAEREAQRQQRESERAKREAAQQQAEAKQAAQTADAAPAAAPAAAAAAPAAAPAAQPARGPRRDCVPAERIEAMRKRGVPEDRIAELKVCPVEAPAQ